jgi:hypothetical protein
MPHVALFVRDSVGLCVGAAPDVPPALLGGPPDHGAVLPDALRAEAGEQWVSWWRQLLAHEVEAQRPQQVEDQQAWLRTRADQMQAITDPPQFTALADRPALRRAVAATFEEACRWPDGGDGSGLSAPDPRFEWSLVKQAAEDVAFDRGVDINKVDGAVLVLAVDGVWSHLLGPGVGICSNALAADTSSAYALLHDVFTSRLR